MRIASLELENIKSYSGPLLIQFERGLNAVCGSNGSGKTTILEAIGFALFDALPYSQLAFVREGAKSGSIRLRLVDEDGREYEIVRKVGSGSTYYVADLETGQRLADRRDEVQRWIREDALDVEGQFDLRELFENAVGVPQGRMTADFLTTAASRKPTFDGLLRVEEYEAAWKKLRETVQYVRDLSGEVDQQIARLQSDVDRIPDQQQVREDLARKVEVGQAQITAAGLELATRQTERAKLDRIEERVRAIEADLKGAEYDVKRYEDFHRQVEADLERARDAHTQVVATRAAYERYVGSGKTSALLETRRADRDGIIAALGRKQSDRDAVARQIERAGEELRRAEEDAAHAADLAPAVARQEQLEAEGRTAREQVKALPSLGEKIVKVESAIAEASRRRAAVIAKIEQANAAQDKAALRDALRERLTAAQAELRELATLKVREAELRSEGVVLKERHDRLAADAERHAHLQTRLIALTSRAMPLVELQTERQVARDRYISMTATLKYGDVARANLQVHHCPLLELTCPVVSDDPSMLSRLEGQKETLRRQLTDIQAELDSLEERVKGAEVAEREMLAIRLEAAKVESSTARRDELMPDLERCREQYKQVRDRLQREGDMERECARVVGELRDAETAFALVAQLDELRQSADELERYRQERDAERDGLVGERDELLGVQTRLTALADELRGLDDPRGRQHNLLVSAGQASALQRELAAAEVQRREADEAFEVLRLQLLPYATLDDELEEQRRIQRENLSSYETYLSRRDEATRLQEREERLRASELELKRARERFVVLRADLERERQSYRDDQHQRLKDECRELEIELAKVRTSLEHEQGRLRDVDRELTVLQRQAERLRVHQSDRHELGHVTRTLGFLRETIRATGPVVTDTLLRNISFGANEIFAEIMDDHSTELRWNREYEVLVQRGAETRRFVQLSGGEQMSAALAVRLALLKEMSEVSFAFFDEPTQNMDAERRGNLAGQIRQVRGFEQLIVISHDDTFENDTDHLIRLRKVHDETQLGID